MKTYSIILISALTLVLSSCFTVVRPGEVGLKQTFGRLQERVFEPGLYPYNFFATKIIKVPTKIQNLIVMEDLPTKDGLNVKAEFSIIYRLQPEKARQIVSTIGLNYDEVVILSVLRSAAPNVTSKHMAKDLYTSERAEIAKEIAEAITGVIGERGVTIEAVLLKTIILPQNLARSVEAKLQAEQEAQQMEFVLQREKREAERKIIEAEGIKKSQQIIAEGLSPAIIQYRSIEAFKSLSNSSNSKVIITNGKTPFLIEP